MNVADAIVETLRREGITTFFCFPTTSMIEAAVAGGLRPVICRQERVGVHMADGFTRVTNGKPVGVFAMQYGPGAENAFAGVASAYSDSSPILLLPLGHSLEQAQVFPLFSSARSYASVTKSVETIMQPEHTPAAMRRAFNALRNGRPGPVMVELPREVVGREIPGNAGEYGGVRAVRSAPDAHDVEDAAKLLVEASNPVILAGQGVLYAEASDELVRLAELLQAPVMTTVDGKSAFPEDHELALGTGGNGFTGAGSVFLYDKADVILAVGCGLTQHPLSTPPLPSGPKLIHNTNDTRDLNKTYDTDVALLGDAKLTLGHLIAAVADRLDRRTLQRAPAAEIARANASWRAKWQPKLGANTAPINPYRVIAEFQQVVDTADVIMTHDSGSPREQLLPFYQAKRPRGYLGWGKSHQLGTGLGLNIGAKIAAPDKFCVNIMGDAAFGMTGLDFETAVRCGVPILTIVFNNSSMAIETRHMGLSHEKYRARDLGGNYANLAKDLGGWSERVEHPGQIGEAILRARRQTEEGRACLLEFITNEETAFSQGDMARP
jgi:thiamine pyrophosphate-dependent acetolactate synthase large subunit-like protein